MFPMKESGEESLSYIFFIISSFVLYFLLSLKDKEKVEYLHFSNLKELLKMRYNKINFSMMYRKVIINSVINMVVISANVVIFSFICALLPQISRFTPLLQGLLEFSRPSLKLVVEGSFVSNIILIIVLLFGGLSIFMQNSAIMVNTNFSVKRYMRYRLMLIGVTLLLSILIFF